MGSERWIAPSQETQKRKGKKGKERRNWGKEKKEQKVKRREILTEIYIALELKSYRR